MVSPFVAKYCSALSFEDLQYGINRIIVEHKMDDKTNLIKMILRYYLAAKFSHFSRQPLINLLLNMVLAHLCHISYHKWNSFSFSKTKSHNNQCQPQHLDPNKFTRRYLIIETKPQQQLFEAVRDKAGDYMVRSADLGLGKIRTKVNSHDTGLCNMKNYGFKTKTIQNSLFVISRIQLSACHYMQSVVEGD